MKTFILASVTFFACLGSNAQTNIKITSGTAEQVILGNYDPDNYKASDIVSSPKEIVQNINNNVSADSLKSYLEKLGTFYNRNTGSDTLSADTGIGAARSWIYKKFEEFSASNENRLIPAYLQFDQSVCDIDRHKNVLAVLPGSDTSNHNIILIEGHMDSRCEERCDPLCKANGSDDNGSGTVLVMELARVMSRFTFKNTIVFMTTTGEEQGLIGATAFATYAVNNQLPVKAVQNNDIVGGIICGKTASPPGCPGESDIDSLNLRIYSSAKNSSPHKGFARFVKLQYEEELKPLVKVPVTIQILDPEDRSGRGGDHIPFRQRNYTAIRFTSANEHGNGNPATTGYSDRQHTTKDILGADTDHDGEVDSFLVDMNYLARNTAINGTSVAMAAIGPETPEVSYTNDANGITVEVTSQTQYKHYRVGVRTSSNDFDYITAFQDTLKYVIPGIEFGTTYFISVCSVDTQGVESLFTIEERIKSEGIGPPYTGIGENRKTTLELLPVRPNPFDEQTIISVVIDKQIQYKEAFISITNMQGQIIKNIPLTLDKEVIEIPYHHGYNASGIYNYSLIVDGKVIDTKKMVFKEK